MDCRTALEILEVVRPDSADRTEPEVASASAHLEDCPRCESRFQVREELDRRVGRAMRDVPVPADLKSRLLAVLSDPESDAADEPPASATVTPAAGPADRDRRLHRRAALTLAASAALGLVAAVTSWVALNSTAADWSLAELRRDARTAYQQFENLPAFEGAFDARLPEFGWRSSRSIGIQDQPRGFPAEAMPHPAAVYHFVLREHRRRPVEGILLVTPKGRVADPPDQAYFNAQGVGSGPYSTVAWTEGDLVYVCVIYGGGDSLDRLHNALRHSEAA